MVGPGQRTSASTAEVSRRTLWDHNISHFIPTPSIAGAVRQAVGEQQRHEERLTAWSSARTFWRRLLRQPPPNPPAANEDVALQIVRRHLDDMGGAAYSATQSGLTISCRMVLKGEATRHLRGLVLETIAWKEARMIEAKECIEYLLTKDLLFCSLNEDAAARFKVDREKMDSLWWDFQKLSIAETFQFAPEDSCLPIYYPDPASWILTNICYAYMKSPRAFEQGRCVAAMGDFLVNPQVGTDMEADD